jgi:hypothetical protein
VVQFRFGGMLFIESPANIHIIPNLTSKPGEFIDMIGQMQDQLEETEPEK